MQNSKLVQLLKTFTTSELKQLGKFIKSPFFGVGRDIDRFFSIIKTHYPKFEDVKLNKKVIFHKLYPGRKYNDKIMRNYISYTLKLTEDFLIYNSFRKDDFPAKNYLLAELNRRRQDKLFEHHKKMARMNLKNSIKDAKYYYNNFQLNVIEDQFYKEKKEFIKTNYLQEQADNFFSFYLINVLKIYLELLSDEHFYNKKFDIKFLNEIMDYLETNSAKYPAAFQVYYSLIRLFQTDDESYYYKLKKLKVKLLRNLNDDQKTDFYEYMSNFCNKMVYAGRHEFVNEYLATNKEFFSSGRAVKKGYLSSPLFISIVVNASRQKHYKWCEQFINDYSGKIEDEHKLYAANYSYAVLYFAKNEHDKALEYLSKINIEIDEAKLLIKSLTLKIYYELNDFEAAISLIDTMLHLLKRDKQIPEENKSFYMKFIRITRDLIQVRTTSNNTTHDSKKQLKEKILSFGYFKNSEWLLKKVEDLK